MTREKFAVFTATLLLGLPFVVSAAAFPKVDDQQAVGQQPIQQKPINPYQKNLLEQEDENLREVQLGEWSLGPEEEEPPLWINEPMYFVVGKNHDIKARFQFSFKYRMFSEKGIVVKALPFMKHFHLGYTQTSLWNLSADSKPFEDSSYRPSFFWELQEPNHDIWPDYWRFGFEHESNGQAGPASRSMNIVFVQPGWGMRIGSQDLVFAPKFYSYVTRGEENADIAKYRGYADWVVRFGRQDGFLAALTARLGTANKGSVQLDLSYPIREQFFSRAGGYVYLQLFHGYGQSLASYNLREEAQVRIGFAIVR